MSIRPSVRMSVCKSVRMSDTFGGKRDFLKADSSDLCECKYFVRRFGYKMYYIETVYISTGV